MELFKQTLFLAFILLIPILSHAQNSPDDYVNAHNGVRAEVGSPCLAWNETLTSYAQSYVQSRLSDCALMLSNSLTYGENLFIGTGANFNAVDAVNAWATEKANYDYASNTCAQGKVCGHYTQLVWNTSLNVGCYRGICNIGSIYIYCSYYPKGNIIGQRPY